MRRFFLAFLFLLSFFRAFVLQAGEIDIAGYLDTRHSCQIKSPNDYLSSETRLRAEATAYSGDASFFVSLNASKNHLIEDASLTSLHEGYMDYSADSWDMRVGRQIIIWGNSDGIQISDLVSPPDLTEFITRDFDEIRMPVDAFKFRWTGSSLFTGEFIFIPFFEAGKTPAPGDPWFIKAKDIEGMTIEYKEAVLPQNKLKNAEAGGKISVILPGIDLDFSYFHTWNDFPSIRVEDPGGSITYLVPEYKRLDFAGVTMAKPCGEFVLRSEMAFFDGTWFKTKEKGNSDLKKNSAKWLAGIDWYPGNSWTVSTQVTGTVIFNYEKTLANDESTNTITLNLSKKLFREKLKISNMIYIGTNTSDIFDRASIDFELTDGFHFFAGADIFAGKENGIYGQYKDNSQGWVKLRFSF